MEHHGEGRAWLQQSIQISTFKIQSTLVLPKFQSITYKGGGSSVEHLDSEGRRGIFNYLIKDHF
jgi:hypothetical protein